MSFPENTPMHFGLHWPCADQLFGGYYAMEMHPPQLQIAQTWLQLWKINLSYKSYGLLLIWPTGFHWGSEFDTWRPWCFRNPAKKFTTSGGDCFLSQNLSINLFLKFCRISKNSRPCITEQNGCFRTIQAVSFWGVAAPQKKHLPNSTQKSSPETETQITLVQVPNEARPRVPLLILWWPSPLYGLTNNLFQLGFSYHHTRLPLAPYASFIFESPCWWTFCKSQSSTLGEKKLGLDTVYAAIPSWKHQSDSYALRTCVLMFWTPPPPARKEMCTVSKKRIQLRVAWSRKKKRSFFFLRCADIKEEHNESTTGRG